ncbi:CoA transferase [Sphingopyxis sp. SE2]|jgi:crotonobetainyl-CoA:carnitine CoA-transferase CaiB-like acyl-CoA transferase|uniref:CaiB/BaiF CoA transferase family protein n=1 Tax=unclassified Sphingopyxis TaxID=2614943 RepID=UPI00050E50AB|nr:MULTISPECIES: CoA transferase [unclassified Sphingopyxis]KGB57412.1 L-carnitine dehydratase/bile acid-inducible protein F [Sphingopyxis sp. LC363]MDT7528101.1 CoA transferase [Sphingopyxis sp. SE2]
MLSGIRVVDLTTVIFGPYATQMLADLGAEVIKIETPGMGDISRYLGNGVPDPTMGSIHLTVNRGKRSIALDLKKPEDAAVLRELIADADVFFHNVRGKAIARLGFDYEGCKALKSDIIYVHGTGFGQDGPYADLQAYDDVIQAATGTTSLLPRVDGNPAPRYFPSLIADKIAGQFGAQAILAALVHKLRTGEGQEVEVPMFECFASFMLTEHLRDDTLDPPIGPAGYPRQLDPTRQPFPTSDGYLAIVPYTPDSTARLLGLLGSADLLATPEYEAAKAKGQHMPIIYSEIARKTPAKTSADWLELFAANDIPAMAARDLQDVRQDPHLVATGFFRHRTHPDAGAFHEMQPPVKYGAMPPRDLGFAPRVDGDGAAIRGELATRHR